MDTNTVCCFCDEMLDESDTITLIGKVQLETFIQKSKMREDNLWIPWQRGESLQVHEVCRKRYSAKSDHPPRKRRRTETPVPPFSSTSQAEPSTSQSPTSNPIDNSEFDFKKLCFFCGKPHRNYPELRRVQDPSMKDRLLSLAKTRDDDFAEEVIRRLQGNISLVEAQAAYHKRCYNRFVLPMYHKPTESNEQNDEAFRCVIDHLENSTTFKFKLKDLRDVMGENTLSDYMLIKKLQQKYGDEIFVNRSSGRPPTIFFKQFDIAKICSDWFCPDGSISEKREGIILEVAASILREKIKKEKLESKSYSPPANFIDDVSTDTPQYLRNFLDKLLFNNDDDKINKHLGARDSIAHGIIRAIHQNSFTSNLQLAIGIYIHRKSGSKLVIDLLSRLGVCASYHNIKLYELSTIMDPPKMHVEEDTFVQFAFHNTDHNVATLDGRETFHCLGGIAVYTPEPNISYQGGSKKLNKMPTAEVVAAQKRIPIVPYEAPKHSGMKNLTFQSVISLRLGDAPLIPCTYATYLWGKHFKSAKLPSWKGFMEYMSSGESLNKSQSSIICLPFINAPPSDLTTLRTALEYAKTETEKNHQETTFLTFDQPLYWKSRLMVATEADTSMKYTVILLGIFHLLMALMGAIGYTMQGSGLEELWSVIYAPESVRKMLTGHAFARALRAHILTFTALGMKICGTINAPQTWSAFMNQFLADFDTNTDLNDRTRGDCKAEREIGEMSRAFEKQLRIIESNSPTSKLWIQYFKSVVILLQLIEAERLGDWELHLQSVKNSLPLFHAAGRHAYAKTAQIYLQDMAELSYKMDPNEYDVFTKGGYFTIRRTDKAWAGISRDMVIEQTLNRFFGTDLKHGRGVTPSVVTRYLLAMPGAFTIMEKLEEYCHIRTDNSEQHVDLKLGRMKRDEADIEKLLFWVDSHNPFEPRSSLMSLSSGVIAGPFINCHMAFEQGEQSMATLIGKTPAKVTISRSFKVKNLASAAEGIHMNYDDKVGKIDSNLLFQKISVLLSENPGLTQKALNYELSPVPLSLFDEKGWMRASTKSELYTVFTPALPNQTLLAECQFVIDGGWLLRQVTWHHGKTFSEIFKLYLSYIRKYYRSDAVVIFDGYKGDIIGVKSYERLRRKEKFVAADVDIGLDKLITTTKDKFLSNVVNKFKFVELLSEYLRRAGIEIKVAEEDADALIVHTAIELERCRQVEDKPIVVVGNDTDLFVLLIGLTPDGKTIHFYKMTPVGKTEKTLYSTRDNEHLKSFILFAHALVGCDSTSAIFNKGKKTVISLLQKNKDLRESTAVFYDRGRTTDELYPVAENIIKHLYVKDQRATLPINELRYKMFISSVADAKKNVLSSLPPTQAALQEHVKRVYFQVQQWLCHKLDPLEWGWERIQMFNIVLIPKKTSLKAAPDHLLAKICCKCARSKCTTAVCECKKAGLNCTQLCRHCTDEDDCSNLPVKVIDGMLEEETDSEVETNEEIWHILRKRVYTCNTRDHEEEEEEESDEEFEPFEYY